MCCCCGAGCCGCGETKPSISRVFYFLWFLFSSGCAWLLREYGAPLLDYAPWASECSDFPDPDLCLGTQAVLRVSFANLCFFAVHFLFLIGVRSKEDARLVLHTSLWPLKLLAWGGITVGFFLVPVGAVYAYAEAARVLSGFFLVFQLISLLDFVYRLNSMLIDRSGCIPVLVFLTAAALITGLVAIGFMYFLFAPSASCGLNIFLTTFTLILGLLVCGVSVLPNRAKESGLFTASAVFLYATFLCFSALNSDPNSQGECQRYTGTQTQWITVCGFLIALGSVGWSAFSGGSNKEAFTFDVQAEMKNEDGDSDGASDELNFVPWGFHLNFTLASAYMAMVLLGWTWTVDTNGAFEVDKGYISLWLKIAAQWVCVLLYVWTVIAPIVLPDRDFS